MKRVFGLASGSQEFGVWQVAGPEDVEEGDFGGMDAWKANNLVAQTAFHPTMLDWIGDPAKVSGGHLKQSLHEWKVVLALYASALWRRPVDLAAFDPPGDLFGQLASVLE